MPVVLRYKGYRFFFYADEGDPREPVHVHVRHERCEAKFWLHPDVRLAYNRRFDDRTLAELAEVVRQHRASIEEQWHAFFA